jgi:hypothetical protein
MDDIEKAMAEVHKNILNENEGNIRPNNQNLKPLNYRRPLKLYDPQNKLLTNKDISLSKLEILFNIDTEPICQNKWNIYISKNLPCKNPPVNLKNYT